MGTRREFLHETTYGALTALTALSGVAEAGRATRSDTGFADPVALCGISHPGNYECVPKFVTFCKLRAGISAEGREKRKRPSGFRKISPQNNFPGRPLSRALESATPIVDGHGKWSSPKPSRKKLK